MERRGLEFTLKPHSLPQSTYECCIDGKTSDMHESSMNANNLHSRHVAETRSVIPAPFASLCVSPQLEAPTHPPCEAGFRPLRILSAVQLAVCMGCPVHAS